MTAQDRRGVLLLGSGTTALSALESLAERFTVLGLVRPSSADVDPVVERARELGVPHLTDMGRSALEQVVLDLEPSCVVVSSYDRVISADVLARTAFLNVHYAPLPRYRGRANVNWAVINGDPYTAITCHVLAPELDAGHVLFQEQVPIGPRDYVGDVYQRLNEIQRQKLGATVERYLEGYQGVPQDEQVASWGCSRIPDDGHIDWGRSAESIDRLVRGVAEPFPGAFTYLGDRRLYIWRAEPLADARRYEGRIPGRVVRRSAREGWVDVLTGDGTLRVHEVEVQGADRGAASRAILSVRMSLGISESQVRDRLLAMEARVAGCERTAASGAGAPSDQMDRGR